eukprot:2349497-Pyramimonas_sp.AAC.1
MFASWGPLGGPLGGLWGLILGSSLPSVVVWVVWKAISGSPVPSSGDLKRAPCAAKAPQGPRHNPFVVEVAAPGPLGPVP